MNRQVVVMTPTETLERQKKQIQSQFKSKSLWHSFGFAWAGICYAFQTQRNFRVHVGMACVAVVLSYFFHISIVEWLVIFLLIGLVLFAELMNTALECLVDLITADQYSLPGKLAKDVAAGAVFVTSITALICGLFIFLPRFIRMFL